MYIRYFNTNNEIDYINLPLLPLGKYKIEKINIDKSHNLYIRINQIIYRLDTNELSLLLYSKLIKYHIKNKKKFFPRSFTFISHKNLIEQMCNIL